MIESPSGRITQAVPSLGQGMYEAPPPSVPPGPPSVAPPSARAPPLPPACPPSRPPPPACPPEPLPAVPPSPPRPPVAPPLPPAPPSPATPPTPALPPAVPAPPVVVPAAFRRSPGIRWFRRCPRCPTARCPRLRPSHRSRHPRSDPIRCRMRRARPRGAVRRPSLWSRSRRHMCAGATWEYVLEDMSLLCSV